MKTDLVIPELQAPEVIERDILYFKNVLPWGHDLVEVANAVSAWQLSTEQTMDRKPMTTDRRRSSSTPINGEFDSRFANYEGGLFYVVGKLVQAYAAHNAYAGVYCDDQHYTLLKYETGDEYVVHIDAGRPSKMRSHPAVRALSLVIYLNDDYEGGALEFPRQKVTLKPEAQSAVMFPSSFVFPHAALPVTRGTKYAITTWFM
jgi:hypothetical protein